MARRKQTQTPTGLPAELPFFDAEEEAAQAKAAEAKSADTSAEALMARLNELEKRLADSEAEKLLLMGVSTPTGKEVLQSIQQPKLDLTKLPDPALDTEGFNKGIEERVTKFVADTRAVDQAQTSAAQKQAEALQALYDGFVEKYADYADPERIEFVAAKVAAKARAKGVDVNRYMFTTSDKFYKDVVAEHDRIFGKPTTDEDDGADDGDGEGYQMDDDRTQGIGGGTDSGGKPVSGRNLGKTVNDDDIFAELREFQQTHGFHR